MFEKVIKVTFTDGSFAYVKEFDVEDGRPLTTSEVNQARRYIHTNVVYLAMKNAKRYFKKYYMKMNKGAQLKKVEVINVNTQEGMTG